MAAPRVRLSVTASTNVRFLTALPADHSVRRALPLLLNKYKAVVSENLGHDHSLLQAGAISSLTKKGCLIARDELVGDVFSNDDEIRIEIREKEGTIGEPVHQAPEPDKREKLEFKKHLKDIMSGGVEKPAKKVEEAHSDKKNVKDKKPEKKPQPPQAKEPSNSDDKASKLLSKFRSE